MKVAEEQNKLTLPAKVRFADSLDRFLSKSNPDNAWMSPGGKLRLLPTNLCELRRMVD